MGTTRGGLRMGTLASGRSLVNTAFEFDHFLALRVHGHGPLGIDRVPEGHGFGPLVDNRMVGRVAVVLAENGGSHSSAKFNNSGLRTGRGSSEERIFDDELDAARGSGGTVSRVGEGFDFRDQKWLRIRGVVADGLGGEGRRLNFRIINDQIFLVESVEFSEDTEIHDIIKKIHAAGDEGGVSVVVASGEAISEPNVLGVDVRDRSRVGFTLVRIGCGLIFDNVLFGDRFSSAIIEILNIVSKDSGKLLGRDGSQVALVDSAITLFAHFE